MSENVFSSLSKYGSGIDENYLTEALVFVTKLLLERKPATGLDMVNLLCGQHREVCFSDPKSILILTQVTTDAGRPDIEIGGEDTLVYIEVKHDSPLGLDQLERYKAQLRESGFPNTRLVLLTRSMNFLEEKRMSMKRVTWEYIQGIPALLNLTDMMETAITEVMPGVKFTRTAGWNWRGFYLLDNYWFGVRYTQPLVVAFEDKKGYNPVTYKRDLNLEEKHFFSLDKDEQFERLVEFLRRASENVLEVNRDAKAD